MSHGVNHLWRQQNQFQNCFEFQMFQETATHFKNILTDVKRHQEFQEFQEHVSRVTDDAGLKSLSSGLPDLAEEETEFVRLGFVLCSTDPCASDSATSHFSKDDLGLLVLLCSMGMDIRGKSFLELLHVK